MSKWDEWKKAQGETRLWHMLDRSQYVKNPKTAEDRLAICKECPELIKLTTQCKKCGCFMEAKTKLAAARCPIGKWETEENLDTELTDEDSLSKIFINIPSYKDPELWLTINNFLDNAKYPERIYFGVTNQVSNVNEEINKYNRMKENKKYKNVDFDIIEAGLLIGCQPARKNSHKMYNNQNYYLNMDSHMRSIKNWDVEIIKNFNDTEIKLGKGLYTGYVNLYELHDDKTHTINNYKDVPTYYMNEENVNSFKQTGIVQMSPIYKNYQRDSYSPYVSGHFFFTRGEYVKQIGFTEQIAFTEEEIFMALRYFTAGYNIYIPKNNYVFHHYGRKNRYLIWEDFPEKFHVANESSRNFALNIINNNIINDEYGLFSVRTLKDFENYSGINFKERDAGRLVDGLEPKLVRTSVDHLA